MKLVNLTGHELTVTDGNTMVTLPYQGRTRVQSHQLEERFVEFEGMTLPIVRLVSKKIIGLPEPQEDVLYIVSGLVSAAAYERDDVVAPGRLLRENGKGRVKGCRAFVKSR